MKTKDGNKILLDIERILDAIPTRRGVMTVAPFILFIFLLAPINVYFGINFGGYIGWYSFFISCFLTIFLVGVLNIMFLKIKHPLTLQIVSMIMISPAALLFGSFFWFGNMSGVSFFDIWFIPMIWALIEVNSFRISFKNSDMDIIRYFKNRFRKDLNGNYLFFYESQFMDKIKGTKYTSRWLYWLENGSGILIMVIAPVLFITSATLKDNFDPRFAIVGIILFCVGLGTRFISTEFYTLRRALKLKQQGKF